MCGIHGFNFEQEGLLDRMLEVSHHRGPDGRGKHVDGNLSLGHNLLAIADRPNQSAQPWVFPDQKSVICYNGEIYNYKELRQDLINKGETFNTDCDTEVLVKGVERYGSEFFRKLNGMFAISWYDHKTQTLTIARDPSGIKPLYYSNIKGRFIFSSSLRSLLECGIERRFSRLGLRLYLDFGYVPGRLTLIDGVCKLIPGEIICFDLNGKNISKKENLHNNIDIRKTRFEASDFRSRVRDSVDSCMMGIRPVGMYLSGGMDSAMILHECVESGYKPKTFTTRFLDVTPDSGVNDDAECAKKLADHYGLEHTEVEVGEEDFINAIYPCVEALEEPRYNRSSPAYFLTAKRLADDGIVVTLAGDGGDELLGGYPKYLKLMNILNSDECVSFFEILKRKLLGGSIPLDTKVMEPFDVKRPLDRVYLLNSFARCFKDLPEVSRKDMKRGELLLHLQKLLPIPKSVPGTMNYHVLLELITWMSEDCLTRNDKLGMAFSMEARFPLLTEPFRKYALGLPQKDKLNNDVLKRHSRMAYEGVLPDYIVNKKKTGWAAPVSQWYESGELCSLVNKTITKDNYRPLSGLLDLATFNRSRDPKTLFSLFYLEHWAKSFQVVP